MHITTIRLENGTVTSTRTLHRHDRVILAVLMRIGSSVCCFLGLSLLLAACLGVSTPAGNLTLGICSLGFGLMAVRLYGAPRIQAEQETPQPGAMLVANVRPNQPVSQVRPERCQCGARLRGRECPNRNCQHRLVSVR